MTRLAPWGAVAATVGWNCWSLRATTDPVAYLDDASIHEQMVRVASRMIAAGHLPLSGWFPYLGLGSPQFLHYQSLGAMLAGLVGTVAGPDTAFRWSLYLLMALWPVVIYASARLLRMGRWAAAAAALVSGLVMSVKGVGYEPNAYVWYGYGLWSQLWASWTLPLAWSTAWRAMDERRFIVPAALAIAATASFHFETGYLAFAVVVLFPFLVPSRLRARLGRAFAVGVGAFCMSAWVIVPLLVYEKWAGINRVLGNTGMVRGYGARQDIDWLFTGRLFDSGRLPVLSAALGAGAVVCLWRWRRGGWARALPVLFLFCFLLSFGPATWGWVADAVPGHKDLFFRRFMMGGDLAGILLAGVGIEAALRRLAALLRSGIQWVLAEGTGRRAVTMAPLALSAAAAVAWLWPAWSQVRAYDVRNAAAIGAQRDGEAVDGAALAPIVGYIRAHGGGRTYAGLPNDLQNWGSCFSVGQVPVGKYLESQDIDEVGYTLRTASLMTQPEFFIDEGNPSDYTLFGIRYVVVGVRDGLFGQCSPGVPPVPARRVLVSGRYALWEIPTVSYVDVVDTTGSVEENRIDVGTVSRPLLDGTLLARHGDLTVAWEGAPAATPTLHGASARGSPGTVLAENADLGRGSAGATVRLRRRAVVLLSASYDPGWRATVDGTSAPVQMLAPAVVGVAVPAGTHTVRFSYVGFGWYPELFALAGVAVGALWWGVRRAGKRDRADVDRPGVDPPGAAPLS